MLGSVGKLLGLLAALNLAACASPQMMAVPTDAKSPTHAIGPSPVVEQGFNHTVKPLDDKNSVIYLQSFGGGGVGLGLLGPLGVAANIKMIEANTDADLVLLKGKITVDPQSVFSTISQEFPALSLVANQDKAVRLTPLLNVVKLEDEQLLFGCTLVVDYTPTGTSWVGRYVYQIPLRLAKSDVANGLKPDQQREMDEAAKAGFRALARMYVDDMNGKLPSKRDLRFKSSFVMPRFSFEMIGQEIASDDARIGIRSIGVVYSLPKEMTQIIY